MIRVESSPKGPKTTTASKPAESDKSNAVHTTQAAKNQNDPPLTFSPVPQTAERICKARIGLQRKRSSMLGRWERGTDHVWGPADIWETSLSPVMEEVVKGEDKGARKSSTDPGPRV